MIKIIVLHVPGGSPVTKEIADGTTLACFISNNTQGDSSYKVNNSVKPDNYRLVDGDTVTIAKKIAGAR